MVTDQTGGALPGTTISVRGTDGAIEVASTTANDQGRYRIDGLPPGRYIVEYVFPNFARLRRDVTIDAAVVRTMDATLQLSMSADVAVTGKLMFRNVADLDRPEGGLIGIADAASEGLVTGRQIDARPIMRAGEVLETVPG